MSQRITCPECGKDLQVPDNLLGKRVQCPECKHSFVASRLDVDDGNAVSVGSKESELDKPGESSGTPKKMARRDDDEDDDDDRDRDDDDDIDVRKSKRRERSDRKPDKVNTAGVLCLVGGILAILVFLGVAGGSGGICCLWPGTYYSLVVGIMAIVRGSGLMGSSAHQYPLPTGIAIMMIINIINFDIVNLVLGIVVLNMCGDEEVKEYLAK
jgi:hypothetical protein